MKTVERIFVATGIWAGMTCLFTAIIMALAWMVKNHPLYLLLIPLVFAWVICYMLTGWTE